MCSLFLTSTPKWNCKNNDYFQTSISYLPLVEQTDSPTSKVMP